MAGQEGVSPGPESTIEEKLLFLQGNMVSFVSQYSMPIIEVSLVVSKFLKAISDSLEKNAAEHGEEIPKYLTRPSINPIIESEKVISEFPINSLIERTDKDRMEIFDTILRTSINRTELPFMNALALLRDWEKMIRNQLSTASSPGHLFSPLDIPDGF